MVYITRKETFSATHKLTRPDWSLEKNEEVFGKCLNYQLWVTVKGEINPETGFVTNLAEISLLLKHYVLDKVDHKNLNMDVDFMKGKLSSTEVLAVEIWKQIENPIVKLGCQLHSIKIQETDKNFIEYFGN